MTKKIKVALAGLGFGAEFVPIYKHHPMVEDIAIVDGNEDVLKETGDKFSITHRYTDIAEVLQSDAWDAVHLVTPIQYHAPQSIEVLNAGKHCACTIPMGLSLQELRDVVAAQRASGKNYMMMETAVYTREYLMVKEMYEKGEFGRIQFLRGAHYQDMDGWPDYWKGFPPLMHPTHAIAPLLDLIGKRPVKVSCLGSGSMREELVRQYNNPFPVESALFQLENSDVALELTRTMFHTARDYSECFNVYGEKATFEWQQLEHERPVIFRMGEMDGSRGRPFTVERVTAPDRQGLLPEAIRRFTQKGVYDETNEHLSFIQGGGHGGSHPHLVHEFVSSIVEGREPGIGAITAANWTAAGICAHQSAMNGGIPVDIPAFE
ncbi:Gfo/Idh/MocA family protein [Cohnella sp. JJ-181]|uniref:Gfo/Idh/MocA family protein n=1 Tax=Cohnella rhizoplanae TaxID=2974897 RepID=UPI0022FFBD17|nr:Gfo/Idh/MocA family oxidoreductase [Cohnella sp. JJ-181]CAI6083349.1 Inositol 2-dehydrogenase/D-chiro-inositol 3-dehydrogenase [Cohnella sp. JJ-181]